MTTSGQSGRCVPAALASADRSVSSPIREAVPSAFLRSDGSSGTPGLLGVVVAELALHVPGEPAQRLTCVIDQRDHPLTGPGPAGALAVTDMKLAEPAQLPFDIGQVELAGLIDPQPDLGKSRQAV